MDITRTVVPEREPRTRIDAATCGTMGVGSCPAIAAAACQPEPQVVCLEGDSAFGFSGMEVEVACRVRLPITFIVLNNNGHRRRSLELLDIDHIPPGAYYPDAHYERVIEAFSSLGIYAGSIAELGPALDAALRSEVPSLVNVPIDPKATRKAQPFSWLTRS